MAIHAKVRIYVHLIWGTHHHERILSKPVRLQLFQHIIKHAQELNIILYKMNIQPEHVHILLNLPSDKTIAEIAQNLKGQSSSWITRHNLINRKFRWQRGYGAYSVSASQVERVEYYIQNQDKHHKKNAFKAEYDEWAKRYGVYDDE